MSHPWSILLRVLAVATLLLLPMAMLQPAEAATLVVNTTDDTTDSHGCDATHCSLREAIQAANARGRDSINFGIPGSGVHRIELHSNLPSITDDDTTIAGDSQPGYSGTPRIVIDGSNFGTGPGISFYFADNGIVRGLSIVGFSNAAYPNSGTGIVLGGTGGEIADNYIGIEPDGTANGNYRGIDARGGRDSSVLIHRNVISGNQTGVYGGSGRLVIAGNKIGTNPAGTRAVRGSITGIYLWDATALIGGSSPSDGNLISGHFVEGRVGNYGEGIILSFTGNQVIGNKIGTNAAGDVAIPNWIGISVPGGTCTGGCPPLENLIRGNLISGNGRGVEADGEDTRVVGNRIGTNADGSRALGNSEVGVSVHYGLDVIIGGDAPGDANLISGNGVGVLLDGEASQVTGNRIGTDWAGLRALPNDVGVRAEGSRDMIGPCAGGAANLISGNHVGIEMVGENTSVCGNQIGVNAEGDAGFDGQEIGIRVGAASGVVSARDVYANTISGQEAGVLVEAEADHISVLSNRIGTSVDGRESVPNDVGVQVEAAGTVIGGDEAGDGNVISGNDVGLLLKADGVFVRLNWIGLNAAGGSLPNGVGVRIRGMGEGTLVGGSEAYANEIAFNRSHGLELIMPGGVVIGGNRIRMNGGDGIRLSYADGVEGGSGSRNTFQRNSIYGNEGLGIRFGRASLNRGIEAPAIEGGSFTDASGTACEGCLVELFIAAPDPSGAGEGRTYLTSVTANAEGRFTATFPRLSSCQRLTATATDTMGNTSVFSVNFQPGLCLHLPPLVAMIVILGGGAGGSAFMVVVRRRPPDLRSIPGALAGAFLGAGVGLLFLALPQVQVGEGDGGQAPAPPAAQAPPTTEVPAAPPSISPSPTFTLTPSPEPPTATPTPTVTPTPTLGPAVGVARQNANCRLGPSTAYEVVGFLLEGQQALIQGRNSEGTWWYLELPDGRHCWVSASTVDALGDLPSVPVVKPPPSPTPTETPELGCLVYNANLQKNLCVIPCPENAQPGDACEP